MLTAVSTDCRCEHRFLYVFLIVIAQKHIWSNIPLFLVLVMFFIFSLSETHRASFDLPTWGSEDVIGVKKSSFSDEVSSETWTDQRGRGGIWTLRVANLVFLCSDSSGP